MHQPDKHATSVIRAWGFKEKQLIPWVKTSKDGSPRIGGGHYTRVCTEQLILATRGYLKPLRRDIPGGILAQRTAHSAKPDASYALIEALTPGPRLELFARRQMPGWEVWGDQVENNSAVVEIFRR